MPTKKPRIQSILEQEIYDKYKEICEREERSESQMTSIIIKKYIKQYESEHGEIKIEKAGQ